MPVLHPHHIQWCAEQPWALQRHKRAGGGPHAIIDNAFARGYTVAWGGDVSEPTFSWKNFVAFTTMADAEKLTKAERQELFEPATRTGNTRRDAGNAFDNYRSRTDHTCNSPVSGLTVLNGTC
ncbi:MAG: hypothetical protein IPH60_10840 [Flavobacteriales bacterium]|nr:hypothetical protein [Flavobacteriales bacterium]